MAAPASDPLRGDHPVVEATGLVRAFGGRRAVDGVDLRIAAGDCLALFGPNGAGKTTLLRLLAGLLTPTAGSCRVDGVALRAGRMARARVGLISHASMLYGALTARENVEFAARMYGLRDPVASTRRALQLMRVADRSETPVRALSRGLQQRVSIARAIVHEPRLLLCDEPYTGLDDVGSAALTAALAERRDRGASLLLVTHNLGEGLALATHAAIMRRGRFARHEARGALDPAAYASAYRELVTADA
ncbi:MAG: heme ABC exporter ATP-binding protein CcmA [Gemmatimonadaceae bacterium]|nr:heme ABC exporter ATP-binding protein CcmA [Gemmatimonadaceae bacterium]NUP56189.1 heme ABC exporter ATP-binding protein CcmA [Gemmatimonadaceae bacterium]NUP69970.1 heme ABC exporter ATP-binding protein CcmA [Gemmatimonadaceae bacterium]NUR35515.1 heme ABC exporter ATP-binding protein CcmA [Gemmatimonadaceae bacterium]NUS33411.1 heme ABC exporter ATP-binding protein CcmA [Gemmatimonadaceae bacterium]